MGKNYNYEKVFKCLVSVQNTLSVCSKCLDCCNKEEKQLYGELSEDATKMIQKLKKVYKQ